MNYFIKRKSGDNEGNKDYKNLNRIGLLNENTHDSLQLRVSCLRTPQADLNLKRNQRKKLSIVL